MEPTQSIRVLYSFPHKIGADRICTTAWHQATGASAAGSAITVYTGAVAKQLPREIPCHTTLSFGALRIPYRIIGIKMACALHDRYVARILARNPGSFDVVHTWPLAARRTLRVARRAGIRSVLERPNAHTRYAYAVVAQECKRLGLALPPNHEHAFKPDWLAIEEGEYQLADYLLCPSDFVAETFIAQGFPAARLKRHQYGYDDAVYKPGTARDSTHPFTVLFAGGCAPRKGLHYALQAWNSSPASRTGRFLIAGAFTPGYNETLASLLKHQSIHCLGYRTDLPELMRLSDALVLPSIEEGSALVTYEARAAGCILLVSTASGAICASGVDSLVHQVGDIAALERDITLLYSNVELRNHLRRNSMLTVHELTWRFAGRRLHAIYRDVGA